ncbi:hypothetical protein [Halosegnis marinus]
MFDELAVHVDLVHRSTTDFARLDDDIQLLERVNVIIHGGSRDASDPACR